MARPDDLDPAQRAAVTSEAAPLCILAAAGSGKTRVLTARIAHRVATGAADPRHVLALTFTRRAAGELRARLGRLGVDAEVTASTFHAVAWAQLRQRAADRGERPPRLVENPRRRLARLVGPAAGDVAAEITWAKSRLLGPAEYEAAGRRPALPAAEVAAAFARYQEELRRGGLLDFDDLLLACAQALEDDPPFAAAQRWRFRHLFVDEYQDLNPAQFRLLRAWLGDNLDLTVVGDPNQAVYGWNGADPELLHRFAEHFPTAEVVRLDTSYRCPPEVLAVATAVLPPGRVGGASPPRPPRHGGRPAPGVPTVRGFHTEDDEARGVARAVRLAHAPGARWSDVAVLARTNAQLSVIEEALRRASIPHASSVPDLREPLAWLARTPPAVPLSSALADVECEPLRTLGREYAALDRSPTVEGFLGWVRTVIRSGDLAGVGDAVALATFHRAKGLEWPVVLVVGLERGLVPVDRGDEAEERRLLYVALTRATRELHCSWAAQRRGMPRSPSPWLAAVEQACAEQAAARDRGALDWRAHLADSRARLAATAP
ncbi:MAG TPA: ATP-dependent helicase [Acidimicrobiales bacterium]|nr:ATP-dependent helicase [Acidimicrobiales bacterium]